MKNKMTDKQKALFEACEIVEKKLRSIGKDCEVITMDDGQVQIAPLSWSGCIVENTLYEAIITAIKERDENER